MGHQTIHTKYHKLFGARILMNVESKVLPGTLFKHLVNVDSVNDHISSLSNLPRYVIYEELLEMLIDKNGTMHKSLNAMIDGGMTKLPYDQVIVEFDSPANISYADQNEKRIWNTKVRHFVWLTEFTDKPKERFTGVQWTLIENREMSDLVLSPLAVACDLMSATQIENNKDDDIEKIGNVNSAGAIMRAVPSHFFYKDRLTTKFKEHILTGNEIDTLKPISEALCALIVLMHTRGIKQEKITVDAKLNKARAKNDKPLIQDHTVIRIGHVYNRDGERVEYNSNTGRTMPVHWRQGHWRQQRWGTGLDKVRPVFIKPMLINYIEGDEPKHKTKEVTV